MWSTTYPNHIPAVGGLALLGCYNSTFHMVRVTVPVDPYPWMRYHSLATKTKEKEKRMFSSWNMAAARLLSEWKEEYKTRPDLPIDI
jgi:hypothetical protein